MGFGSGDGAAKERRKVAEKPERQVQGFHLNRLDSWYSKGDEIWMVNVSRSKGLQSVFEKVPDLIENIIKTKINKDKKIEGKLLKIKPVGLSN